MSKEKLKRGEKYYLILHKRDWSYKPAVIVPVTFIKRYDTDWVIVRQEIDGISHKLTVHIDWLALHNTQEAKNVLHNMRQREKRIMANSWRFRLNYKTAAKEVIEALGDLSRVKQRKIWAGIAKVYPELLKAPRVLAISKVEMEQWSEIAWAIIRAKFPTKEAIQLH